MIAKSLDSHIEITPGTLGGKPRIAGRRIAVSMVAEWHLEQRESVESICQEYDLSPAQVHAALAYYFDHKTEIDRRTAEDRAYVEQYAREYPEVYRFRNELEARQAKEGPPAQDSDRA